MGYESQTSGIVDHAFLANLYEGMSGNGVISGGVLTGTGTDRVVSYTAFTAIIDGSFVSVGASSVTHSAGDATNPRMDLTECNASGTVAIVAGTPTAESASQTRPPLPAKTAGSIALGATYVPAAATVILDANVFDRRVIITPLQVKYKTGTQVFTTDTTFADISGSTGTMSFAIAANEIVHCRFRIPISFGGTGGVKLQLTGPSAPTLVRIDAFSEALVGAGQDSVTNNESDTIAYRRLGTATAFSSSFVALNSPAATVNSTVNAVLGIPQAGTTIVVEVEIVNGATAGTVVLQGAQNSANSTTTFAVGSSMAVEKKAGLAI